MQRSTKEDASIAAVRDARPEDKSARVAPKIKPPTLRDVALAAGVSPYTVSAVVNGARSNTQVSEATRRRIVESARLLNYHPNAMARSLALQKTNTIGVVFGIIQSTEALLNSYVSGLLQGMMMQAAEHHLNVLLYTEPWKNAAASANSFRNQQTDGIIVVAPLMDTDMLPALAELPVPLVTVSPDPRQCPGHVPAVDVDNVYGIEQAVRHLVGLGHTRIAHLFGEENVASVSIRRNAFLGAMRSAGLSVRDEYLCRGTLRADTVREVLPGLMNVPEPPTAIVAGNDNIALAILTTAREMGISVPDDLSVVGFDDVAAARQVTPGLTTLSQPLAEIGRAAVQMLLSDAASGTAASLAADRKEGDGTHGFARLIRPELVVRGSTAPVRPMG